MLLRYLLVILPLFLFGSGCQSPPKTVGQTPAVWGEAEAKVPLPSASPKIVGNRLAHRVLPMRIAGDNEPLASQLSPDGRYVACFDSPQDKRERFVIYDLATFQAARFDVDRAGDDSLVGGFFAWRGDSRACAAATSSGVAVVTLGEKQVRWASRKPLSFAACLAWSPLTHQLAIFEGDYVSQSYFEVWDGQKTVRRRDWQTAVGEDRTAYETSAMQAQWSADEKFIALRYEGRSGISGTLTNPMHLAVLDVVTGRARWRHNQYAGPMRWLDNSRLIFQELEDLGVSGPLVVADVRTGKAKPWRKSVGAWTVSPKNDEIWALVRENNQSNLYQTSAREPQWKLAKRGVWKPEISGSTERALNVRITDIFLSPAGDMMALNGGGERVELLDIASAQTWRWQGLAGPKDKSSFWFLGWPTGQKFPLVAYQPEYKENSDSRQRLWQLEAPR